MSTLISVYINRYTHIQYFVGAASDPAGCGLQFMERLPRKADNTRQEERNRNSGQRTSTNKSLQKRNNIANIKQAVWC